MITDYQFQPYVAIEDSKREKTREKIDNLKDLMFWGQKYVKNCDDPGEFFYRRYVKNLRYNSMMLQK